MKIFFVSLGCDKNLVDSEIMIKHLKNNDYSIIDDIEEAETIVVNTCCFIDSAKEESIETILDMATYKENTCKYLIVCGCMAQRYHVEIKQEIPEVDAIIGTTAAPDLVNALEELKKRSVSESLNGEDTYSVLEYINDINLTVEAPVYDEMHSGGYSAYIKIAEGCNKHCTYCVIPKIRGNYRSVPIEKIMEQANHLVNQGAKELILVAQETTIYGTDLYGKKSLHTLISMLSKLQGVQWIRVLYCYPEEIYDELIYEMKNNPKVCHYIDMPIQHASDNVLKRMGRRTTNSEIRQKIKLLRDNISDIVIRTTLITGFPGETEEDFLILREFVEEMKFDRLGVFTYSQEENTPAALYEDQISQELKEERRDEIMELQQNIVFQANEEHIGDVMPVIIEGYIPRDDVYVARSYMDSPDVDGLVFVNFDGRLESGDFVRVEIIEAKGYDLIGEVI